MGSKDCGGGRGYRCNGGISGGDGGVRLCSLMVWNRMCMTIISALLMRLTCFCDVCRHSVHPRLSISS